MYEERIKLVAVAKKENEYGDLADITTEREVFADVKSIGGSEFYQAKANGIKPEIKFVLADYLDYQDETLIRYQPYVGKEEEYQIIRTYRTGTQLEITCKRGVDE